MLQCCVTSGVIWSFPVRAGHEYRVTAGRTLLLPCSSSSSRSSVLLQRWSYRRAGGRRDLILTCFRNGSSRAEREDGTRLSCSQRALQIQHLQRGDAGLYQCNRGRWDRVVVVLSGEPRLSHLIGPVGEGRCFFFYSFAVKRETFMFLGVLGFFFLSAPTQSSSVEGSRSSTIMMETGWTCSH